MKIETKYNLNDRIYTIHKHAVFKYDGRAKWLVEGTNNIDQIRVAIANCASNGAHEEGVAKSKTEYRLCRSGTVWPEDHLFNSHEEAQAECDRRNGEPYDE